MGYQANIFLLSPQKHVAATHQKCLIDSLLMFLMKSHNMFSWRNKKNINLLVKKEKKKKKKTKNKKKQKTALSEAMQVGSGKEDNQGTGGEGQYLISVV